jgi:hypothetical protein
MGDLYLRERVILCHVDPLLDVVREIGNCTAAITGGQLPANNRGAVFKQQFNNR